MVLVVVKHFPRSCIELEDTHQAHLHTGLDEIIGHMVFAKYLKWEQMIIQVFLNAMSSS